MWRLFLIVLATPAFADSVVATRAIAASAVVTAEDVTLVAMEIQGAAKSIEDVIGQVANTAIAAGRIVQRNQISAPIHVERNSVVTLILQAGGLEIRTEGRALAAGKLGETIDIMNLSSRSRLRGAIIGAGIVRVFASQ